jgi:heat shock protein HslJ
MTFEKRMACLWICLSILLVAACAPPGSGIPVTGETDVPATATTLPDLPPEAVLNAQQWLARLLNAAVEEVKIVEVEQAEWSDSCLGLGKANESCAQVITLGWQAVFEINGQTYEVRTDETGSNIRLASPSGTPGAEVGLENTIWMLKSFGPPGAETPLVEESMITLILAAGQAGGFGGCNGYGGTYQVHEQDISFGQITSTLIACVDERTTEQEGRYFQALDTASSYEMEDNQLRITYDDGAGLLVFETP